MATNLTPEQLAELARLFNTPVGAGNDNAYMPSTVDYGGQSWKKDDTGGYASLGPLYGNNQYKYTNYNPDGTFTAEGEARMSDWSPEMDFLKAMGVLIGGGLAMGGPAGFGFGGGAAGSGGMVNGAFLGEAPWTATGGGALDFGGTAAGAGGAVGGGASIGSGAGNGAFLGEGVASGVPAWDAAATKAGLSLTGAGSSLLPGISDKALGIGASLLGGALGSQGQKAEQSSTRDIPDWLKPYVTNTLTKAQGLFDTQMSPEYQQRWTNLGNQAQGLLAQPMAGNGFNRFFPGK